MEKPKPKFIRRLVIDVVGFGLILGGILFGWLPGPGGIPLIIAGLAVLAQNYDWADKLMQRLKNYVRRAAEQSFPEQPGIQLFYDIFSTLLLAGGLWLLLATASTIWRVVAIVAITQALVLFFGNRKRGERLSRLFYKKKR